MGILDDAIREHLELKRAHGASDHEVRQKEAEAFGPVRTDVPAEAPAAEQDAAQVEADDPYAVHPGDEVVPDPHHEGEPGGKDPAWGDDTDFFSEPATPEMADAGAGVLPEGGAPDPGPPAAPDLPAEPAPEAPEAPIAPSAHPEDHRRVFDTDEHLHAGSEPPQPVYGHQAEAPPAPAPVEQAEPPAPPALDEPTQPHEPAAIEEEPPAGEPGDEDVLEETPEFLQDAPEHDRLWFEQKPPRDFDFGE